MAGIGIPKEARTKKPKPFSGKRGTEAEGFLTRMDIYFGDYDKGTFNDNQKISATLMNMASGDAAKWAQSLLQKMAAKETQEFFRSWESFKAAFLRNFADPVKKEKVIPDQEKECQKREKLCIKCGKPGHVMKDCCGKWTYKGKPKVQGKAGAIEEEKEDKSKSEN
ncbi:hypothetical protein FRC07_004598 [Ceratobasidium sp. 392]|nr:hypothetical protein FRC07_004598 [Ceratobasidium sp. 392]